jgi:hypothetical protein
MNCNKYTGRPRKKCNRSNVLVATARSPIMALLMLRLSTKGKFEHGHFEARIRVPFGQGIWRLDQVANSDKNDGAVEIRVLCGIRGQEPTKSLGSVHGMITLVNM